MAVDQQQQRAPTVPPHDLDAEESVLGAMLVSANAIAIVSEVLQPEDFYRRSHATIYETILRVYAEGGTIDSITLINSLQNQGQLDEVGGKAAVNTLASTVPAVANAHRYAEIVRDASTYRNLIRAGTQIAQLGYERLGEPQELVDQAEQVVFGIADQRITSDFFPIADLLNDSFERITQLHESGRDITGVSTGYRELDKITAGLPAVQPGDPGRPPGHGQDVAGTERGRPRRHPRAAAGRDLHDRDVARRGHPAADVLGGQGRLQPAAHRQACAGRVAEADRRLLAPAGGADLHRRHGRHHRPRDQGQDAAAEGAPPEPGAGRSSTTCS